MIGYGRILLMRKKLILLSFFIFILSACGHKQQADIYRGYDLPQMRDSGELVVLTMNTSTSYFIYRGQEMGYQYELIQQFAENIGMKFRIETARSVNDLVNRLLDGEGDIIAYNLPVTKEWKDSLIYCGEEIITHQVIVQRNNGKEPPLTDVTQLIGKDIYVKPGRYHNRLVNLNNELGGGIQIHCVENDSVTVEDLITQVAKGDILYTVCDNDLARLNATYYPQLNVKLSVSLDQRSSWAVRKESPILAQAADAWNKASQNSPAHTATIKRYFEISKNIDYTPIISIRDGRISHYDHLFKKYSKEIGWDWRLLAAVAFTESNFNPEAISWAGAKGLMQLMPGTARAMGMPEGFEHDPEESVKAAVRYFGTLNRSLSMISDRKERINFILASYNAGLGHIFDAMALTEKYGKDKNIWFDHVEKYLLLKSNEEYYTDPVCRNGYFRGLETYDFVRKINSRFERYCSLIKE